MAKMSQEQAKYRNGNPIKHCGLCLHYLGGECEIVEGDINPHMISNEYDPYLNPLKEQGITFTLKGSEIWRQNRKKRRQDTGKGARGKRAAEAVQPEGDATVPKGPTRIGNKVY